MSEREKKYGEKRNKSSAAVTVALIAVAVIGIAAGAGIAAWGYSSGDSGAQETAAAVSSEVVITEAETETVPEMLTINETTPEETTPEETTAAETEAAELIVETAGVEIESGAVDSGAEALPAEEVISWNPDWEYASYSEIHEDSVTLYRSQVADRKNIVVAVNAGHGTKGGNQVRTQCHPDGSAKVTGGSTSKGSLTAAAVSGGMTFLDGTGEAVATLSLAFLAKEKLLEAGYDVLMIRETDDCRLDNIARTVFANQNADCHLALHYDSTDDDRGFFYISVPDVSSYRSMEPVASHWQEHNALGASILQGMKDEGVKIRSDGSMAIDLTQTSYSTIPSVDVEVGDRGSDYSESTQSVLAQAIVDGVNYYFSED